MSPSPSSSNAVLTETPRALAAHLAQRVERRWQRWLEWLRRGPSRRWWGPVALSAWFVVAGLAVPLLGLEQAMRAAAAESSEVRYGMLSYQLALSGGEARWVLAAWGDAGREAARRSLWLDFAFIPAYGVALIAGLAWLARRLGPIDRRRREQFGLVAAALVPFAVLLDLVENAALLHGLAHFESPSGAVAVVAGAAAMGKLAVLVSAATFGVAWVGWRASVTRRGRRWLRLLRLPRAWQPVAASGVGVLLGLGLLAAILGGDGAVALGLSCALVGGAVVPLCLLSVPVLEPVEAEAGREVGPEPPKPRLDMVRVPDGGFPLGGGEAVIERLLVSRYATTRAAWLALFPDDERWPDGEDRRLPANTTSWFDAIAFCNALSTIEGLEPCYRVEPAGTRIHSDGEGIQAVRWNRSANGYRLPTEAEWEYVARAGTRTRFSWEDQEARDYAWFGELGGDVHPVGGKKPNQWGLYDTAGNVWEWCWDWWADTPVAAGRDDDDQGEGRRVLRGGSCISDAEGLSPSFRYWYWPEIRYRGDGFRCVRSALPQHG